MQNPKITGHHCPDKVGRALFSLWHRPHKGLGPSGHGQQSKVNSMPTPLGITVIPKWVTLTSIFLPQCVALSAQNDQHWAASSTQCVALSAQCHQHWTLVSTWSLKHSANTGQQFPLEVYVKHCLLEAANTGQQFPRKVCVKHRLLEAANTGQQLPPEVRV